MKTTRKKRWWIWILLGVVLLPVVYLLAVGPFVYFHQRLLISYKALRMVEVPIHFADTHGVLKALRIQSAWAAYREWWSRKAWEAEEKLKQMPAK